MTTSRRVTPPTMLTDPTYLQRIYPQKKTKYCNILFTRSIWLVKLNLVAGQLCHTGLTLTSSGLSCLILTYWSLICLRFARVLKSKVQKKSVRKVIRRWYKLITCCGYVYQICIAIHPVDISPKNKNVILMVAWEERSGDLQLHSVREPAHNCRDISV